MKTAELLGAIREHAYLEGGGRFLVPVPSPRLVP